MIATKESLEEVAKDSYDVVIIGSGLGGMVSGALLSKYYKVLILEAHPYTLGGCTHNFHKKGLTFVAGLHYVGNRIWEDSSTATSSLRMLLEHAIGENITNESKKVEWKQMDQVFDEVVFMEVEGDKSNHFQIVAGKEKQMLQYISYFPEDEMMIRKYFQIVEDVTALAVNYIAGQVVSSYVSVDFLAHSVRRLAIGEEFMKATSMNVLEGLKYHSLEFKSKRLRNLLLYGYGNYGQVANSTWFTHCVVTSHYFEGAAYPIGGPEKLVSALIETIESNNGGKAMVNAMVDEIIVDESSKQAVGVKVKGITIKANHAIISAIGAVNTQKLLNKNKNLSPFPEKLPENSPSHAQVFIGLRGSNAELNLKARNYWLLPNDKDLEVAAAEYYARPLPPHAATNDDVEEYKKKTTTMPFPFIFLSFPSAKDPEWSAPNRSVAELVFDINPKWFERFANLPLGHRGDEYHQIKTSLGKVALQSLLKVFPQLENRIDFVEVSTSVTAEHFLHSSNGASYGLAPNTARYHAEYLKPRIFGNLYLAGQDVIANGIQGGSFGGLIAAASISPQVLLWMRHLLPADSAINKVFNWLPISSKL